MQHIVSQIEKQLVGLPVSVALVLPDGRRVGEESSEVELGFKNWRTLATLAAGHIGSLGEAYVEERMKIKGSMRNLMDAAAGLLPGSPVQGESHWWTSLLQKGKSLASHTHKADAEQIQFHYDVSDDFYALWLDPKRVYSCAYYQDPSMTLALAQEAKLDHICRKLKLQPGQRLLDIGCGWGAMLLWAAEHYGIDGTGITLSKNQHAYVTRLIEQKGLQDRVRVQLLDYRDLDESQPFDRISSIGMFEHVGRANMVKYFAKVNRLLKPGGIVMNHGITAGGLDNAQLGAGMGDFIEKYIFPGGELLHSSVVLHDMAEAGLEMVDSENLRPHYAKTLWAWSDALESQLEAALKILVGTKGSETQARRILRAYRLYLAGCAMSFERGWISLHQFLAVRPDDNLDTGALRGAQSDYPFNREYIYR